MALSGLIDSAIESLTNGNTDADLSGLLVELCRAAQDETLDNPAERKKFVAVVSYLLGIADWNTRFSAGEQIIGMANLPSEVFLFYACDKFSIAKTFLQDDVDFSDEDLLHVVRTATIEHRMAVAERSDLTPTVVRELMRQGGLPVIRKLAENEDSAIFYEYDDTGELGDGELEFGSDLANSEDGKQTILDQIVIGYAEKRRYADLIEALAKGSSVPKAIVKDMFQDTDHKPFLMFCKGIGIGDDAFASVSRFRVRRLGQLDRIAEQSVEEYQQLERQNAEAMVEKLQDKNSWIRTA